MTDLGSMYISVRCTYTAPNSESRADLETHTIDLPQPSLLRTRQYIPVVALLRRRLTHKVLIHIRLEIPHPPARKLHPVAHLQIDHQARGSRSTDLDLEITVQSLMSRGTDISPSEMIEKVPKGACYCPVLELAATRNRGHATKYGVCNQASNELLAGNNRSRRVDERAGSGRDRTGKGRRTAFGAGCYGRCTADYGMTRHVRVVCRRVERGIMLGNGSNLIKGQGCRPGDDAGLQGCGDAPCSEASHDS